MVIEDEVITGVGGYQELSMSSGRMYLIFVVVSLYDDTTKPKYVYCENCMIISINNLLRPTNNKQESKKLTLQTAKLKTELLVQYVHSLLDFLPPEIYSCLKTITSIPIRHEL